MALIRLRGCAGWSAPLLFAKPQRFSHDEAHIVYILHDQLNKKQNMLLYNTGFKMRKSVFEGLQPTKEMISLRMCAV